MKVGILGVVIGLMLSACGQQGAKVYPAEGTVREVQPSAHQVVIEHGDIPGLMPPMTMSFDVPDAAVLAKLTPGSTIRFQVEFDGQHYRVVSAEKTGEAGDAGSSGPTLSGMAAEKDVAPGFRLTDQDGKPVALEDFRGKTVVLDFIFTRCSGPCPVLTGLQRDVQRALTPEQNAKTHFVSISFDPEFDTPEVLKAYAVKRGADLANWSFLTGSVDDVAALLKAYGVAVVRKAGEEPAHLVASFVIDPNGRIAERIVGLETTAEDRARRVVTASGS